ncbi:hypothetical protein LSH36_256g04078 [Paralvinella palmiformis]|uniref:Protein MIS12 homolog n=1 Tax=Paralvinella palmiformis TaxID=53620 RepID=A0AAD9JKD8_9ANNE|nr:hypothetical protein LSH36_256g04078 [Paralvinella palmiformis]
MLVVIRSVALGDLWPAGCWDRTGVDVVAAGFGWKMSDDARSKSVSSTDTAGDDLGDQEYETQFLGFAPRKSLDVRNMGISALRSRKKAQSYLKVAGIDAKEDEGGSLGYITYPRWKPKQCWLQVHLHLLKFGEVISEEELKNASEVFLSTVTQKIDENFDKFETYIFSNVMHIPRRVVLPEDQVQEEYKHFTVQEEQLLDDDIRKLKERIIAAKYVNVSLRNEYKQLRHVREEYDQLLALIQTLNKTFKEARVSDMHESLVFAANKASTIISLIGQMREASSHEKELMDASELEMMSKSTKRDATCSSS